MKRLNPLNGNPYRRGFKPSLSEDRYFIRYILSKFDNDGFYEMQWGSLKSLQSLRNSKSKWQSANKDKHKISRAKSSEKVESRAREMITGARGRAKNKNLPFDLTYEWVLNKLKFGKCELSGINFDLISKKTKAFNKFAPSIDRIDSSKGYTKDNCRVIVTSLNIAINHWGLEHYLYLAKKVIANQ